MTVIRSRDNARVKRWARLVHEARARREAQRVVVEGVHLVGEALAARLRLHGLVVSESGMEKDAIRQLAAGHEPVVLADTVFRAFTDVETPQGIAAEIELPRLEPRGDAVFLEGVQDPSNVGAIIRTTAAFGAGELVLDRGCADAWGSKCLRAGMGGHFKVAIRQVTDFQGALDSFNGTLLCTVPTQGIPLRDADLKGKLGWVFGAEGAGVSEETTKRAQARVTIPMAAGSESLNVAAAAAICLYEAFSRSGAGS